jgi:subtilisin-like proprotein convertase family protein
MLPLLLALLAPPDLRLETVRVSLTGTHCRSRIYVENLPTDDVVVWACDPSSSRVTSHAMQEETHERWFEGRRVRRSIVYDAPLEPYAEDVDVETGVVVRRIPLFYRATSKAARVFDVNPVVATNDPSLQDRNDSAAAIPQRAYDDVQLQDVEESGALRGPYVALVDRQSPAIAPPDASGSLVFDREQDGFEDVQAYFHIDRSQRYVQSLGYTGTRAIAPYAIEVDAHAVSGTDTSFFQPSLTQIGRGTLFFGEGGTDDAEDADLVVHEYGHALLEWIAPGTFAGANVSEARAVGEGFGDYWAFSTHAAARAESGRDPFCFADWDARCWEDDAAQQCSYPPNTDCLRRLDSTATMANYERVSRTGVEHQNGTIWSSALREIHGAIGKEIADTIILESAFDAPPQPTFAAMARLLLRADRLLFGGVHATPICSAFTSRAILTDCGTHPRGELTVFASGDRNVEIADLRTTTSTISIADARTIERVLVHVDLEHEARGDLQIELVAPDGTVVVLQTPAADRGTSLRMTYDSPALDVLRGRSAAGTWTLRIIDQRIRDAGTLRSWNLQVQLAGEVRATERPRAAKQQMIPVAAHLFGANDTAFRSDLRIANVTDAPLTATLIFTPSTRDGRTDFAAVNVALAARQTVAFDDVVESAFGLTGSGSLEILGDVIAMSRMTTNETTGQQIPPNLDETSLFEAALHVASIGDANSRVNIGFTETRGLRTNVHFAGRDLRLEPYSHVQMSVPHGVYDINSVSDVVAYISQVDNTTGDAMFVPAELDRGDRAGIAPAIARQGADRAWRSDLWLGDAVVFPAATAVSVIANGTRTDSYVPTPEWRTVSTYEDILGLLFHGAVTFGALRVEIADRTFAGTRVATDGMSQFIPLQNPNGPLQQHLVFIDTVAPYRTNIGIVTEHAALAEVTLFDANGVEIERFLLSTEGGVAQTSVARAVSNARAVVRFLSGTGRAYASLVDSRSGDATFVAGQ